MPRDRVEALLSKYRFGIRDYQDGQVLRVRGDDYNELLIEQADRGGCQEFDLPHTKRDLAEIFGVTRPSLSRVFIRLCEESILSQEGRHITIHHLQQLREIAENVAE
ncbi:MAG: helix-turn-helix domain-containing protein [Spirochaetaceae bacterium]